MDAQHDAQVTRNGVPLSVLEYQRAVTAGRGNEIVAETANERFDYVDWTSGYLQYLMYARDLAYGRQLASLYVLTDPDDPVPNGKPGYLVAAKTEYIVVSDPQIVYPAEKPAWPADGRIGARR